MILLNTETNFNPKHPKNWVWNKTFAWLPVRVDDGRVVWLEYVLKTKPKNSKPIYQTRKFPRDFDGY